MFSAMLEAVLTRMPGYELEQGAEVTWFPDVSFFYGVTSLPVVAGPGTAEPATEGEPCSS